MFKELTKYIAELQSEEFGEWIVKRDKKTGIHNFPFVNYEESISNFIMDVYKFLGEHEEFNGFNYNATLEKNGIEWGTASMEKAKVDLLDGKCIIALLIGVIRADRFSEGTLLYFLEKGIVVKWLKRLEELM